MRLKLPEFFWTQKFKKTEMHKLLMKLLGRSSPLTTSKMEVYVTVVNDLQPLTDITKNSTLDVEMTYPTGAPSRIDVDSTWILRRYVEDQISTNFDVVSTYLFRCNFDGRKIHLVSTYYFRCNFFCRNIHSVCTYFFRRNFDGRITHFVCKLFFRQNFDEFDGVVGKL